MRHHGFSAGVASRCPWAGLSEPSEERLPPCCAASAAAIISAAIAGASENLWDVLSAVDAEVSGNSRSGGLGVSLLSVIFSVIKNKNLTVRF